MRTRFVLPALASLMACAPALADVAQLTSSSGLSATDTVFSVPGIAVGPVGSPVTYATADNALTFTAASGTLEVDTVGFNYGDSAFPNGTRIIYAGGFSGAFSPLTVAFANPVSEFGFSSEEFNGGSYLVSYTVNFTRDGIASSSAFTSAGSDPGSLSFIGARAAAGSVINSVVLSDGQGNNLSAGPVSYANFTTTAAVPELATWCMMVSGFGLVGSMLRRRRGTESCYAV